MAATNEQGDGIEYTLTDPYAFQPVLTEFDRHLISAGTHYELYRKLGANLVEHQGFKGLGLYLQHGTVIIGHQLLRFLRITKL